MIKAAILAATIIINVPDAGGAIDHPPVENPELVVAEQAKQCWALLPNLARISFEVSLSANFDVNGIVSDAEIVAVEPRNSDTEQAAKLALEAIQGCGPYQIHLDESAQLQVLLSP